MKRRSLRFLAGQKGKFLVIIKNRKQRPRIRIVKMERFRQNEYIGDTER